MGEQRALNPVETIAHRKHEGDALSGFSTRMSV